MLVYDIIKERILMNAFLKSQVSYYPLIWMCCNRSLNNKINRLHERFVTIMYSNNLSIQQFLKRDRSVSVHHQNIRSLAIEMF